MNAKEQYKLAYRNWRVAMKHHDTIKPQKRADAVWDVLWNTHMQAYGRKIGYAAVKSYSSSHSAIYEGSYIQKFHRDMRRKDRKYQCPSVTYLKIGKVAA